MSAYNNKMSYVNDDEKTLYEVKTKYSSSSSSSLTSSKHHKLSKAVTLLKTKLGGGSTSIDATKSQKQRKAPLPPNYYPTTRQTFEAIATSRM